MALPGVTTDGAHAPGEGGDPRAIRRAAPPSRALAVFLAGLLFVVVVWQAPHSVHHLFEGGDELHDECAVAALAERTPAAAEAVVIILPVHSLLAAARAVDEPSPRILAHAPTDARAPPA